MKSTGALTGLLYTLTGTDGRKTTICFTRDVFDGLRVVGAIVCSDHFLANRVSSRDRMSTSMSMSIAVAMTTIALGPFVRVRVSETGVRSQRPQED